MTKAFKKRETNETTNHYLQSKSKLSKYLGKNQSRPVKSTKKYNLKARWNVFKYFKMNAKKCNVDICGMTFW